MAIGDCKQCGAVNSTGWERFVDEEGFACDDRGDYCDYCLDVMAERSQKRREWDHYHDEPCPEIELPQCSILRKVRPVLKIIALCRLT